MLNRPRFLVVDTFLNVDLVLYNLIVPGSVAEMGKGHAPGADSDIGIVLNEQRYFDAVTEVFELYVLCEARSIVIALVSNAA